MINDFFGREIILSDKRLWLLDMDGTIYTDDKLFEGTLDFLNRITESGGHYVFITNNSSKSVLDYIKKIADMGIYADESNFFTSSQATIQYLKAYYNKHKVYCQGTRSLVKELKDAGIEVTENVEEVQVVLVGFDTELTSEKLQRTCEILSTQKVAFLATNPDLACPVSFGFVPDCGSICAMIKNATRKTPVFIGKPEPTMVDSVREKFGVSIDETIVVGDRLYTDIATGINAGVSTVCVLTGEAKAEDIINGTIKPTYTVQSVRELAKVIGSAS